MEQNNTPSIGAIIGFTFLAITILGVITVVAILQIHFSKNQSSDNSNSFSASVSNPLDTNKQKFNQEVAAAQNSLFSSDFQNELRHGQTALTYAASDRDKATAHFWIANGYLDLNDAKQADAEATLAVQLDPNFANAYGTLALAKLDESNLSAAYTNAKKAVELKPNAGNHNILGVVLQAQGKKAQAIAEFKTAVSLDPQNTLYRENLLHAQ